MLMALSPNPRRGQRGFTLVELSIVLVIIGILLIGILKGRDMVTTTKASRLITDAESVHQAMMDYQLKFGFFPGDDSVLRFASNGTAWTYVGNGNQIIEGEPFVNYTYTTNATTDFTPTAEAGSVWGELRAANFLPYYPGQANPTYQYPTTQFTAGTIGVSSGAVLNWGTATNGQLKVCFSNVPGGVAAAVDGKYDDGIPNTGNRVRAILQTTALTPMVVLNATPATVYDNEQLYTLCVNYH